VLGLGDKTFDLGAGGAGVGGATSTGSSGGAKGPASTSVGTTASTSGSSSGGGGTSSSASMAAATSSSGGCNGTIAGQVVTNIEGAPSDVVSVALDAQALYWTTGVTPAEPAQILRANKSTLNSVAAFGMSTDVLARSLVLDAANAYWITTPSPAGTGDTLWQIPKAVMSAGTRLYTSSQGNFGGIATGNGLVYFTSTTEGPTWPVPGIYTVGINGNAPVALFAAFAAGTTPGDLVLDGGRLYVIVQSAPPFSEILAVDLLTKMPMALAQGETNPHALAFDATYVYWATPTGIRRISKAGGQPQAFGPMSTSCGGISIDASFLYCTDATSGSVFQMALANNIAVSVPVLTKGALRGIAADCSDVYFASGVLVDSVPKL
jgi:hypothetical protein